MRNRGGPEIGIWDPRVDRDHSLKAGASMCICDQAFFHVIERWQIPDIESFEELLRDIIRGPPSPRHDVRLPTQFTCTSCSRNLWHR